MATPLCALDFCSPKTTSWSPVDLQETAHGIRKMQCLVFFHLQIKSSRSFAQWVACVSLNLFLKLQNETKYVKSVNCAYIIGFHMILICVLTSDSSAEWYSQSERCFSSCRAECWCGRCSGLCWCSQSYSTLSSSWRLYQLMLLFARLPISMTAFFSWIWKPWERKSSFLRCYGYFCNGFLAKHFALLNHFFYYYYL